MRRGSSLSSRIEIARPERGSVSKRKAPLFLPSKLFAEYVTASERWRSKKPCSVHAVGSFLGSMGFEKNRPRFSVFGVGPYSFAPWKVATSGFYKRLDFRCIGPVEGRPVVLDDTCYFLPCWNESDATALADLLNSHAARAFFRSFIFWDSKRPITAQLLASLDLRKLARETGVDLPTLADAPEAAALFDAGR